MNVTPENPSAVTIRPPQLIQSLVGGFNAVANNVTLILLPVILDLLLWFGPHLHLKSLVEPDILEAFRFMRLNGTADMRAVLDNAENLWKLFLENFNLLGSISTFPVGIPSLMTGQLPMKTPLGAPVIFEIGSYGQLSLAWLGLTLLGFLLGSFYFAQIARVCGKIFAQQEAGLGIEADCSANQPSSRAEFTTTIQAPSFRLGTLVWQTIQVIAMVILLIVIMLLLIVPSLIISTLLALVSPFIAQMAMLLIGFSVVWFMIPLIFTPHGIFLCGQSVFNAMLNSMRLVRHMLPGTGIFLLALIILNQGLGLLWRTPPETSWMALVGIFGHAFIFTGLLAASFVYYRNGLTYVQAIRKMIVKKI